jgi:hypothetical protein
MKYLLLSLLLGCGHFVKQVAPPFPISNVSDSLIVAGFKEADLVILGTPDSLVPEGGAMASLGFGEVATWWNTRITVDSVAKGKLGRAKYMDYGDLPQWLSPPRPFKLAKNQIMVQQANVWTTAPLVVGYPGVFFLKKCYNCVTLPRRTQYPIRVSPWGSLLSLTPDQWGRVKLLTGVK